MTSIYNSTTTTLLVDTTSARKIVFLPVASTVGAGRLLWIKDISGNAAVSSIFISTIGMDRIENSFMPSTLFAVMSTSYGSVLMTTDGILNWYFLQHYYRNAVSLGSSGGSATGGTTSVATISGTTYVIHTFTTVGATSFIVSSSVACDYLVVAGGGGGGTGRGGGGGGGGVLQGSVTLTTATYTITVGDRGNQSVNDVQGGDGGSSSIAALVVTTGGGGGGGWITNAGRNGGSGGGASAGSAASGGTGVAGQGFGGSVRLDGNTGGGGGGAGAAASGSTGAIGITSMITGSTTYYAGGGGAGAVTGGAIGIAFGGTYGVANGTYGGGNGAATTGTNQPFQNAVANTGGGGGGQEGYTGFSGFGGSGIVIIRYPTSFTPTLISGISHWFDATDSSTITLSSGYLTQWNDKSGGGRNLSAVSGLANATVSSAFQNGLNVFNFSGNGLYRSAANNTPYPLEAYIIVALKSLTTHVDVLGMGDTATDSFNSLTFSEHTASRWHNGSSSFTRTPNCVSPTNETSTGFLLIQWSIANNNFLIRRNGTQLVQTASYTYTLPSGSVFQIGFRYPPSNSANFSGYIGELVVFNTQLGTTSRQQIEGYLAWKWGIQAGLPAGHPYLSSRP
jgi:hypothetical protein